MKKKILFFTMLACLFSACEFSIWEIKEPKNAKNVVTEKEAQDFIKTHKTAFYKPVGKKITYQKLVHNQTKEEMIIATLKVKIEKKGHEAMLFLFKNKFDKNKTEAIISSGYRLDHPIFRKRVQYFTGKKCLWTLDGEIIEQKILINGREFYSNEHFVKFLKFLKKSDSIHGEYQEEWKNTIIPDIKKNSKTNLKNFPRALTGVVVNGGTLKTIVIKSGRRGGRSSVSSSGGWGSAGLGGGWGSGGSSGWGISGSIGGYGGSSGGGGSSYWEQRIYDKYRRKIKKIYPCPGDPVPYPRVAAQLGASGRMGGMFGMTRYKNGKPKPHKGMDLISNYGDPIYAMKIGYATLKNDPGGLGYYVEVDSGGTKILYGHMKKSGRKSGLVLQGDIIGWQGDSGNLRDAISGGWAVSHLHIKVKVYGKPVDPRPYLATKINRQGYVTLPSDCN